ncbi:MAG TPA: 1-(5-phosphoribosyl)-5-[(5-phosphoribosylamino)methylideneamino]imidazole-4-carboxamide isomerase [Candidatus Copromorpha excrementigallinarum]|uniref:1-(5-phosphoribosyl)-5-[(5-phosphoribosylamino)methylideneamino] imidazole-4-carboxamide isomerase n=1 Tax=Candidatus Allocopromorpha excrementigallinarum TaxID=2840742 RepID=A0A9D1L813_9FIRM|nr:1-(5-phosphoribosyl)-5-[(5-phosphoribosylamino)methylideneamino]imidazole-4-carboxamide isomerase [Candidatus Copromorpha excrementigallinarum]
MKIFPAIDLREGKAVRLFQGDYDKMTVYSDDPVEVAKDFRRKGASNLHIVDLDGARDGRPANFDTIKRIVKEVDMFVQVGGGIRDEARIRRYLELGVGRVILGTAAVKDPGFLAEAVKRYGEKIAVGVDARDGLVAVSGWKETTAADSFDFCVRLRDEGVRTVIYTDISRDGSLRGTNMEAYKKLSSIKGLDIIASGGISSEEEIAALKELVSGAILGKAVYSGKLDLQRAVKTAEEDEQRKDLL